MSEKSVFYYYSCAAPRDAPSALKETATSYQDGWNQGNSDAFCDEGYCHGHGYYPSCPSGHTDTFCDGYARGYAGNFSAYANGWIAAFRDYIHNRTPYVGWSEHTRSFRYGYADGWVKVDHGIPPKNVAYADGWLDGFQAYLHNRPYVYQNLSNDYSKGFETGYYTRWGYDVPYVGFIQDHIVDPYELRAR